MADITKTQGIVALAHQEVIHPGSLIGPDLDVSTHLGATLIMYHAMVEAVANTNPASFLVQTSGSATGNEDWATIAQYTVNNTLPDNEPLTATEPIGETVLTVASTTGFLAGDIVYIQDTSVVTDGEWGFVEEVDAGTSINLFDGLTNAKDSADIVFNDANIFIWKDDIASIGRLRVLFLHRGATGANAHVKALMVRGDSIG